MWLTKGGRKEFHCYFYVIIAILIIHTLNCSDFV